MGQKTVWDHSCQVKGLAQGQIDRVEEESEIWTSNYLSFGGVFIWAYQTLNCNNNDNNNSTLIMFYVFDYSSSVVNLNLEQIFTYNKMVFFF